MQHRFLIAVAMTAVMFSCATLSGRDPGEGVTVSVTVLDEDGRPIPTAVIRHPEEEDPHRVNSLNGEWYASELYLPGGGVLVFTPGMHLELEVSAPGYVTRRINYDIVRRRNEFPVTLNQMVVNDSDIIEPTLEFGRDRPREGMSTGASN